MKIKTRWTLLRSLSTVMGVMMILPLAGPSSVRAAGTQKTEMEKTEVEKPEMKMAKDKAELELNENEVENEQEMAGDSHGTKTTDRALERQAKQAALELKEAERAEHMGQTGADNKGREIEKEVPEVRDNASLHGGETGHDGGGGGEGKHGVH